MIDYLQKYVTERRFDVPRMLNDDFFLAIKVLLNAGYYISATKLLLSFIDTMSYLEYGDRDNRQFKEWLDCYVDLQGVGVTSEQLWEHRNSLLHMSTLNSRKVADGSVRRIVAYVGQLPPGSPTSDTEADWFSLLGLYHAVARGLERYIQDLSSNTDRLLAFMTRYDHILSDTRLAEFGVEDERLSD